MVHLRAQRLDLRQGQGQHDHLLGRRKKMKRVYYYFFSFFERNKPLCCQTKYPSHSKFKRKLNEPLYLSKNIPNPSVKFCLKENEKGHCGTKRSCHTKQFAICWMTLQKKRIKAAERWNAIFRFESKMEQFEKLWFLVSDPIFLFLNVRENKNVKFQRLWKQKMLFNVQLLLCFTNRRRS